jgi:PIN domain nuclease of toxin-antitoxin system
MEILRDTNGLNWWVEDLPLLGQTGRQVLVNPSPCLFCSSVSMWKITITWCIRKQGLPGSDYAALLMGEDVNLLPVARRQIEAVNG